MLEGQMVYYAMIVMVNVLVNPMSLVTNVISVVPVTGIFLPVQTVPVIRVGPLTLHVISQVDTVLVLLMLVGINVMLVILDGMNIQNVKNVFVTLLVPRVLVALMMVELVHVILVMLELNVTSVLLDGTCIMAYVMRDAQLTTLHLEVMLF
jgi:hypothetical protein